MNQTEHITLRIAELEQAMLTAHPQMPMYIKQIHSELLKAPELVHIMTNEQRATLVRALEKQSGVSVFSALLAKKPSAKALAGATLEDLGL